MAKDDVIEVEVKEGYNASPMFTVELQNDISILATVSGKIVKTIFVFSGRSLLSK